MNKIGYLINIYKQFEINSRVIYIAGCYNNFIQYQIAFQIKINVKFKIQIQLFDTFSSIQQ